MTPRRTDVSNIEVTGRVFINVNEWDDGDSKTFYFTGYEKVNRISKSGNQYFQYLIYLLPIESDGTFSEEMTLGVFPSQAQGLKKCGVTNYQELTITKTRPSQYEEYVFVAGKKILAEKDRPASVEYPDMNKTETLRSREDNQVEDSNFDDIPF